MKQVQNGDTVTVNYTGRLEDGTIFDTSKQPGREPISSTLGQGQLIPGFEKGIIGMVIGETKTVEIEPQDAYGPHNPGAIQEVFLNSLPPVEVGSIVSGYDQNGRPVQVKVISKDETTATIDLNHPLAGKKLIFEIELIDVK
jgi:FKBP-type peptidyl-prolyl cis-trans isomerase 2